MLNGRRFFVLLIMLALAGCAAAPEAPTPAEAESTPVAPTPAPAQVNVTPTPQPAPVKPAPVPQPVPQPAPQPAPAPQAAPAQPTPEQYAQQADSLLIAAGNGDAQAALRLGLLLDAGKVSGPKYANAAVWFSRACEGGALAGCHNVGVAYEYGKNGVVQDFAGALAFYRKAADRGFIQSQYNLGSLYSNGHLQNDAEGYAWMLLAERGARACDPAPVCKWILQDPPGHRARLKARLTEQQVAEIQKIVAGWTPIQ